MEIYIVWGYPEIEKDFDIIDVFKNEKDAIELIDKLNNDDKYGDLSDIWTFKVSKQIVK